MPEVIITVSPEGEAQVEVDGVCGPGCKDLTRAIENSIGKTVNDQITIEYSMAPQTETQQQNAGQS